MPLPKTNPRHISMAETMSSHLFVEHAGKSALDAVEEEPRLLVQIPDLDAPQSDAEVEELADSRLISQHWANRLVMGTGIFLVIVAILPYLLSSKQPVRPAVKELPMWQTRGTVAPAAAQLAATPAAQPSETAAAMLAATNQAGTSPAYLTVQQPQVGANRPMALGDRTGEAVTYQADARSEPARGDRTTNQVRGAVNTEEHSDFPGTGHLQGNPLMPPPGAAGVEPASQGSQNYEPGVARLQGMIATPSVGTDYDRAGSSNN